MKHILLSSLLLITSFLFSTTATSAASKFKVYSVTKIKVGSSLQMRAWPSRKSKVILAIPHNATWVASSTKLLKKENIIWRKIHWNSITGWVDSNYLKYDKDRTAKAKKRRKHRMKQQGLSQSKNSNTANKKTTVAHSHNIPKASGSYGMWLILPLLKYQREFHKEQDNYEWLTWS